MPLIITAPLTITMLSRWLIRGPCVRVFLRAGFMFTSIFSGWLWTEIFLGLLRVFEASELHRRFTTGHTLLLVRSRIMIEADE